MTKVYLCGITQNKEKEIDKLTSVYQYFDGLIFVDGGSTDGTLDILNQRMGNGAILHRNWTNDHDLQMNEFLRQGPMEISDWFIVRDSNEVLEDEFCKDLRSLIAKLESNDIKSVYWEGKGFMFKYYDNMLFLHSPHWGLMGARDKKIELKGSGLVDDNKVTYNNRQRTTNEWWFHHLKYYWEYGRSNHLLLGNENNICEYNRREKNRLELREILHNKYNVEFTNQSLHDFLQNNQWWLNSDIKHKIEDEPIVMRYYRFFVLKEEIEDIINELGEN